LGEDELKKKTKKKKKKELIHIVSYYSIVLHGRHGRSFGCCAELSSPSPASEFRCAFWSFAVELVGCVFCVEENLNIGRISLGWE
jgi:hypothetical protein